jgi:hypothetical protein
MIDILEIFFKTFFEKAAMEKLGLFFGGILFCLVSLAKYYRVFERVDANNDLMREVAELLKEFKQAKTIRDIKRKIENGEDLDTRGF